MLDAAASLEGSHSINFKVSLPLVASKYTESNRKTNMAGSGQGLVPGIGRDQ